MKLSSKIWVYLGAAAVAAISFTIALHVPAETILAAVVASPGAGALFLALWQITRDQVAHERHIDLKEREQIFNLTVTSHMAQVAFDRHVAFCDEYIQRVSRGVTEMFGTGPHRTAMDFAIELSNIRIKHAPWVPKEVTEKITPFEKTIWEIGSAAHYAATVVDAPDRTAKLAHASNLFMEILETDNAEAERRDNRPDACVDRVGAHIQEALGISELHQLRQMVVSRSVNKK